MTNVTVAETIYTVTVDETNYTVTVADTTQNVSIELSNSAADVQIITGGTGDSLIALAAGSITTLKSITAGDNLTLSDDGNTITISATEDDLSNNTTDDLAEGTNNQYFTDARVMTSLQTVSGDILPDTTLTHNLGSVSKAWHSAYVGPGSLYIDGQKVLGSDASGDIDLTTDSGQNLHFSSGADVIILPQLGEVDQGFRVELDRIELGSTGDSIVTVSGTLNTADVSIGGLEINGTLINQPANAQNLEIRTNAGYLHANVTDLYVGPITGAVKIDESSISTTDATQLTIEGFTNSADMTTAISTAQTSANSYTDTAIANLADSAPETLNTLNELAAALGDDANFSTTVTNSIATKWTQDNTKISNWDTAYSWGDHSIEGYITDYTVTEADVTGHQAALTITESQISDLTHYTDNDVLTWFTGTGLGLITSDNIAEGSTNLYHTDARVQSVIDANSAGFIDGVNVGDVTQHQAALVITESQISDLQAYLTAESNDLSSIVTWANVPDVNITQSSVTQHQAALSITESQISDLTHYTNTDFDNQLATKNTNDLAEGTTNLYHTDARVQSVIDTNSAGFITDYTVTEADVTGHQAALVITESQISDLTPHYTDAEARDAVSLTSSNLNELSYDALTGVFTYVSPTTVAATGQVVIDVRNTSGADIARGDAVYISGHSGSSILVTKADANQVGAYPAIGLANSAMANNSNGTVLTHGEMLNLDTSAFATNDVLYLSEAVGELTNTRPTSATSAVQNIGKVARSDNQNGIIIVSGSGRANDTPNLSHNHVFIGNSSGIEQRQLTVFDTYDVTQISTPSDGHVLVYNSGEAAFVNTSIDTDSLSEGTTNLYHTATRVQDIIDTNTNGYITSSDAISAVENEATLDLTGQVTMDQDLDVSGIIQINDGFTLKQFNPYAAYGGAAMNLTMMGVGEEDGWAAMSVRSRGEHDWGLSGAGIPPEAPRAIVNLQAGNKDGSNDDYLNTDQEFGNLWFSPYSGYRPGLEWLTPSAKIDAVTTEDHGLTGMGTKLVFSTTTDGNIGGATDSFHTNATVEIQGTSITASDKLTVKEQLEVQASANDVSNGGWAQYGGYDYSGASALSVNVEGIGFTQTSRVTTDGPAFTDFKTVIRDYDFSGGTPSDDLTIHNTTFIDTPGAGSRRTSANYTRLRDITVAGTDGTDCEYDAYNSHLEFIIYDKASGSDEVSHNVFTATGDGSHFHKSFRIFDKPTDSGDIDLSGVILEYTGAQKGAPDSMLKLYEDSSNTTTDMVRFRNDSGTYKTEFKTNVVFEQDTTLGNLTISGDSITTSGDEVEFDSDFNVTGTTYFGAGSGTGITSSGEIGTFGSATKVPFGAPIELENLGSDPASPSAGMMYFNNITSKFRGYNGTAWVDLG